MARAAPVGVERATAAPRHRSNVESIPPGMRLIEAAPALRATIRLSASAAAGQQRVAQPGMRARAGVSVLDDPPSGLLRTFSGRLYIDEPPPGIENACHRADTPFSR